MSLWIVISATIANLIFKVEIHICKIYETGCCSQWWSDFFDQHNSNLSQVMLLVATGSISQRWIYNLLSYLFNSSYLLSYYIILFIIYYLLFIIYYLFWAKLGWWQPGQSVKGGFIIYSLSFIIYHLFWASYTGGNRGDPSKVDL